MSVTELTQKQCQAAANNAVNTAMCIIKNGLDLHFNRDRDFMNALLGDLLPSNVVVRFEDGVTSIQVDTAEPQVTITRGPIVYVPKNANMSNEFVRFDVRGSLKFEISTAAKTITDNTAIEIANYLCLSLKPLQNLGIRLQQIEVSPISHNRPEHANFYIATVAVGLALPSPVWTNEYLNGKLREIRLTPDILFVDDAVSGSDECLTLTTNH